MPRKPNITAKYCLKIEFEGSTSPKTRFSGLFFEIFGLTGMKIRKNESVEQGVAPYGAQGAPPVNADVGTGIYMATARTMDPPQLRNEGHGRRGNDIGNEARNSR